MGYFISLIPYSFFTACENTYIAQRIDHSLYAFAIIETIHIIGLSILLGSMVVVDIRLIGLGSDWGSPTWLAKELAPWIWTAMLLMIATGIPLFLSEATRLSRNPAFYYKVLFLLLAFGSHFTVHRKATGEHSTERIGKLAAFLSLACWFGVALAGRAIAFIN